MAIVRTIVDITSSDSSYEIPGDLTADQFINGYGAQVQGLSNMSNTSRVENRAGVGEVRVLTFTPRQGTKG